MKKYPIFLYICTFLLVSVLVSCNSKKMVLLEYDPVETQELSVADSLKIRIDVSRVDSVVRLFDNGTRQSIVHDDYITLSDLLLDAQCDTALNKSGVMLKMQAPHYTVMIFYKDLTLEQNDWLMIWRNANGRIQFKNIWYFLAKDKRDILYNLLDKYKEKSN